MVQKHSSRARRLPAGLCLLVLSICGEAGQARAQCDELIGRVLQRALAAPLQNAGCGPLAHLGLTEAAHHLEAVCYASSGPVSTIQLTANLSCKTGDHAFIKGQTSERVTATAEVRGADCSILKVQLSTAGEIGKILSGFFAGRAREALAQALKGAC